jgi:sulfur carrier protein
VGFTAKGRTAAVKGVSMHLPAHCSIEELLAQLSVSGRYAVEINGEIVPRSAHGGHLLAEGDVIEVVAAIGGG